MRLKKKRKIESPDALRSWYAKQHTTRRMPHTYNTRYQKAQRPPLSTIKPVSKLLPQSERANELNRRWHAAHLPWIAFARANFRLSKSWIRLGADHSMTREAYVAALRRAFIDANPQFIIEDLTPPWEVIGCKAYVALSH